MSKNNHYVVEASVDEINFITWNQEIEQERKSAVFDLINNGKFKLYNKSETGPYRINIKLLEWKLVIVVVDLFDNSVTDISVSVSNVRRIIRDYQIVCDNYIEAIKTAPLKKIEAVDIGRRTIHDEGSEILLEAFKFKIELDMDTARRLFTLISIMSIKI